MNIIGKYLIVFGVLFIITGLLIITIPKIPFVGKLPGDIHIKKENFEVYIPLATSLILSILLSGLFWLIQHFRK